MTGLTSEKDTAELDLAIRASPTPLLVVNEAGKILAANQHLCALFQYERTALEGQPVEVLVPSVTRGHHDELRDAFHQLPTKRSMGKGRDLYGQRSDGELIPVEIGLDPQTRESGVWVFVSVIDIRERVAAARRLSLALDAVSNGVIMLEKTGEIVLVNSVACEMFGYSRDELIGECIDRLVPERYRRKHPVFRSSYAIMNQPRTMGAGKLLFALRADGSEFPVEIGLTPIHSPEGLLVMSTVMDLTESQLQSIAIEERNRKLSVLNAELTQFAYSASHDLKAPLSSISGLMQVALDDLQGGDVEELEKNLEKALTLSARLASRIEALLAIARAEDALRAPQLVNLNELVKAAALALHPSDTPSCTLELDLGFSRPLKSNNTMLSSILENLLSNALKFTDPRKKQHWVKVATKELDGCCVLSVSDNGTGIPKERHPEVFKMFRRFSNTHPGSGLGLALVLKYIQLLEGSVEFESSPEGTTFFVRFQLDQEEQA